MENVILTRSMLRVIKPLMDQIDLFSLSVKSDSEDFPEPEVEDICNSLLKIEDPQFSEDVVLVKVALRDFYDVLDNIKKKCNYSKDTFQRLLWNVYKFLLKKDCITVQNIQSLIKECNNFFLKFVNNIKDKENIQHLQAFVQKAVECLKEVKDRIDDIIRKKQRQQLLLCIHQISKCVPLLVTTLSTPTCDQSQVVFSYLAKRISWCFQELEKAVESTTNHLQERECGGQFVQKMDIALDILSSNFKSPNEELKAAIDEALCHAMSIAHVAVDTDCTSISRSCQKVLRALEELTQSHRIEQPPMQALLVGALTDALEQLEQQVNSALLQLVLEVFSSLFSPLKGLLEVIDGPQHLGQRSSEDLDEAIIIFDLLMDRIMQIGLFAVACSQDTHRAVGIRSCLASLESLEPELVPALTALYLEPRNAVHRTYLKVLVGHWKEEVAELQGLLHGIVDPAAFCEVTLHDVSHIVASVKAKLPHATIKNLRLRVDTVLKKAAILRQQLHISLEEEYGDIIPSHLKQIIEDFYFSHNELNAAAQLFLQDKSERSLSAEESHRLLKRCELLVSMIKKLQPLLVGMGGNESRENTNVPKTERIYPDGSTLLYPNTLRDVPVDHDSVNTQGGEIFDVKNTFSELMRRGKALTKERSVLYCTPKKNWEHTMVINHMETPQIRTHNIFNRRRTGESLIDQTLGLEITNILENLTFLSDTLTSAKVQENNCSNNRRSNNVDAFTAACEAVTLSDCDIIPASASFMSSVKSCTVAGSMFDLQCLSHEVDSLQRIDDLKAVQEKIANLRASVRRPEAPDNLC